MPRRAPNPMTVDVDPTNQQQNDPRPRRYWEESVPPTTTPAELHLVSAAPVPANVPTRSQTTPMAPESETEHFDIHDHSDVDEEDYASSSERSIPQAHTQRGQSSNTANPTTPDPLVSDNLRTNGRTNNIQYFFEKMSEASTCKLCL